MYKIKIITIFCILLIIINKYKWILWYNYIAKYDLETMNYGYADKNERLKYYDVNYYSFNLYKKVFNIKLNDQSKILEIGCGRGTGIYYLAKLYPNYNFVGIDRCDIAIKKAKLKYNLSNLKFEVGDAELLPFKTNSFDAIINIESSHCYKNFNKFLEQVKRVLKDETGNFCYADFRNDAFYKIQDLFDIKYHKDITLNVIQSLQFMKLTRQNQIKECNKNNNSFDKLILSMFANEFVADTTSNIYKNFKNGKNVYIHIHAINNKNYNIDCTNIFTTKDIRKIGKKKLSKKYFNVANKLINKKYEKRKNVPVQTVVSTNQKYSKQLLKSLSNNYTKPVIFKNCKLLSDKFEFNDQVQIKDGKNIKLVEKEKLENNMNIFNQKINKNYFSKLNKILKKEIIHYDYFETNPNHYTGILNEINSTINLQIEGTKRWTLIDTKYSDYLLPASTIKNNIQY